MSVVNSHAEALRPVVCKLSGKVCPELLEVERQSNRPPWGEELFEREFANRYSRIYGARLLGRIVGFLVVHVVMDEAHVVNFGILTELRGQGIGRVLLEEVLEDLRREAHKTVTLEVRAGNLPAINLYQSVGFAECGIRPAYYSDNNEDALTMRLDLTAPVSWRSTDDRDCASATKAA
ncbi:MAG: ribosomal protein S18-alanine N-acetyltransferase [Oligoflexia bacterium]|nr:ribosomal protein S18-alanine N-acetyltransferase [Oligoflexia bacterium]